MYSQCHTREGLTGPCPLILPGVQQRSLRHIFAAWAIFSQLITPFFQRYQHYIENGIKADMLAPQPPEVTDAIKSLIPEHLLQSLPDLLDELFEEVRGDYEFSVRKGIGKFGTFTYPSGPKGFKNGFARDYI